MNNKKKVVSMMLGALLVCSSFTSQAFAADTKKVTDKFEESYTVETFENFTKSGYEQHDTILTYFNDGSFTHVDEVTIYNEADEIIDSYVIEESSKPKIKGKKPLALH
ncbi:hypothetical protein AAFJ72_13825 [Brevibacillus gelatini]|uniref:hypothetical protein n=1 Tax=Brevibacillus gelatini TaxID=1655277 RepID=UPI003D815122